MSDEPNFEVVVEPDGSLEYEIFGELPIQALGTIADREFYFRLRHGQWTFEVADENGELRSDRDLPPIFYREGKVTRVEITKARAKELIRKCAKEVLAWVISCQNRCQPPLEAGADTKRKATRQASGPPPSRVGYFHCTFSSAPRRTQSMTEYDVAPSIQIVIFGPPLAGKTSLIIEVAKALSAPLDTYELELGIEDFPPHTVVWTEIVIAGICYKLLTIPGSVWGMKAWEPLFERAAAVVLILDPQVERQGDNVNCIEALDMMAGSSIGCFVVSKQDLAEYNVELADVSRLISLYDGVRDWKVFSTRIDRPQTLLEPVG